MHAAAAGAVHCQCRHASATATIYISTPGGVLAELPPRNAARTCCCSKKKKNTSMLQCTWQCCPGHAACNDSELQPAACWHALPLPLARQLSTSAAAVDAPPWGTPLVERTAVVLASTAGPLNECARARCTRPQPVTRPGNTCWSLSAVVPAAQCQRAKRRCGGSLC